MKKKIQKIRIIEMPEIPLYFPFYLKINNIRIN